MLSRLNTRFPLLPAAIIAGLTLSVAAAPAHDGTEGDIKYRQQVMKSVGAHTTAAAMIIKGESGKIEDLATHARALADLAKISASIFPAGSGPETGKTDALPEVWNDPEDFAEKIRSFIDLSAAFAEVASGGDRKRAGGALGALAKDSCKACHQKYRKKS